MSSEIMPFLRALAANNSLDWMHEHKDWYRQASAQFEDLIQALINELAPDEPALAQYQPKELTFRLNRDTRFSADKSPYRTAFRAHISPGGRAPIPVGYYIQLAPDASFLGGGLFAAMFPEATTMVRDYITGHGQALEEILNAPDFAQAFTLQGEQLKRMPRGYEDYPQYAQYLKYKSWYLEYPLPDESLDDTEAFLALAVQKCRLMKPFNDYLNNALTGFTMPQR